MDDQGDAQPFHQHDRRQEKKGGIHYTLSIKKALRIREIGERKGTIKPRGGKGNY